MTHAAVDTAAYREIIDHAGHLPAVEELEVLDRIDWLEAELATRTAERDHLAAANSRLKAGAAAVPALRLALAAALAMTGDFAGTPAPPDLQEWAADQLAGSAEPLSALVRRGAGALGRAAG